MTYHAYDRDELKPASSIRVEHIIYENEQESNVEDFLSVPLQDLVASREKSVEAEREVFGQLKSLVEKWERQAGVTLLYDKAIEYLKTPASKHTSNQWVDDGYRYIISNAVYQMSYSISENTRYNSQLQKVVPYSWTLRWSVYTNAPRPSRQIKIAGQDRKVFTTMEGLNKYLTGRIKAYQHLFTEIYPEIPKECADCFKINGMLLPGYKIASK